MTKDFTKGQAVTHFSSWDDKGTISYRQCVVHSCGQHQMVLIDAKTGECVGRHFSPAAATGDDLGTRPALSDADAQALALQLGGAYLIRQKAFFEGRIAFYNYGESDGYTKSIRKSIAALHEPRFEPRTGSTCRV